MSLPRYPAYKDSGVSWLGEVPAHWEVKRLRFVAEFNPSKSEIAHLAADTQVSFLPMDAIGDDGSIDTEKSRELSQVDSGYTYFRDEDVVVAKITPCFENGKGAVMRGLLGGVGFGTTELIVARPKMAHVNSDFLHAIFVSSPFRKSAEGAMYGAGGQKRVPDDFVRNFHMAFPPIAEQKVISEFIERETAKIDALIAEQEKLIALLAEKRQATISHAVTRGLEPNVPLKDSGVPWLGKVPAHWEVKKLKYLGEAIIGLTYSPEDVTDRENGVLVLRSSNVQQGEISLEDNVYVSASIPEKLFTKINDILICSRNGSRSLIGKNAIIKEDSVGLSFGAFMTVFRSHINSYLFWVFGSQLFSYQAGTFLTSTINQLTTSNLYSIDVPLPPEDERFAIADSLISKLEKLGCLKRDAEQAILLLKERRSALISAAVTGKIDVRGLAA